MRVADAKESNRIEALSDGVFAVAITLLVLDIRPPEHIGVGHSLWLELGKLWPYFLAYVLSFATIGIMWMNHHRLFRLLVRTDSGLELVNGALLLFITFVPFPTMVFAQNLTNVHASEAAAFYSGTFVVLAVLFNVFSNYIHRRRLVAPVEMSLVAARLIRRQYMIGPIGYSALAGIAFVNVYLCLALHLAFAAYFAIPPLGKLRSEVGELGG